MGGQFNTVLMAILGFSAVWVTWCNQYFLPGIILGALPLPIGATFLCAYLLFLGSCHESDVSAVLGGTNG